MCYFVCLLQISQWDSVRISNVRIKSLATVWAGKWWRITVAVIRDMEQVTYNFLKKSIFYSNYSRSRRKRLIAATLSSSATLLNVFIDWLNFEIVLCDCLHFLPNEWIIVYGSSLIAYTHTSQKFYEVIVLNINQFKCILFYKFSIK